MVPNSIYIMGGLRNKDQTNRSMFLCLCVNLGS